MKNDKTKAINYISSRAIVFNSQNEILVVSRDNIIWELPGGGVDENEKSSSEMCLKEIYEETGLNAKIEHFTGVAENCIKKADEVSRNVIFYYKCNIIGTEELDTNWKDLGYDVIKFRKFVSYIELKNLNGRKSLKPIQNLSLDEIKNTKGKNFGFINYLF